MIYLMFRIKITIYCLWLQHDCSKLIDYILCRHLRFALHRATATQLQVCKTIAGKYNNTTAGYIRSIDSVWLAVAGADLLWKKVLLAGWWLVAGGWWLVLIWCERKTLFIGWLISQPNRVNIYILSVYVYICCICFLHCLQLQQYICVIWLAFTQNVSCLRLCFPMVHLLRHLHVCHSSILTVYNYIWFI